MPLDFLTAFASVNAFLFGICGSVFLQDYLSGKKQRSLIKKSLSNSTETESGRITLESEGWNRWVLEQIIKSSRSISYNQRFSNLREGIWGLGLRTVEEKINKAGLTEFLSIEDLIATRKKISLQFCALGCLLGLVFSEMMAFILALTFFIVGYQSVIHALKNETMLRAQNAEYQLSQMIEIVKLGLGSGLNFDKSLLLYCDRFETTFAQSLRLAHRQWTHGLMSRNEALNRLAHSYDSLVLNRAIGSIVRSNKFGTSLTETLTTLASEARAIRKAKIQEKVAKVPVKMLMPIGALILPAMLILVLGPILLDLMVGF